MVGAGFSKPTPTGVEGDGSDEAEPRGPNPVPLAVPKPPADPVAEKRRPAEAVVVCGPGVNVLKPRVEGAPTPL